MLFLNSVAEYVFIYICTCKEKFSGGRIKQMVGPVSVIFLFMCSLHEQSIVKIVTNVFFSLITIVFGLERALDREIIVGFGKLSHVSAKFGWFSIEWGRRGKYYIGYCALSRTAL